MQDERSAVANAAVEIIKETAYEASYVLWQHQPPRTAMTVVVKGSFDLVPGGVATVSAKQALPLPETLNAFDTEQPSVRYDSDLAFVKRRAECFLAGTGYTPGGKPLGALTVQFQVGNISKTLAVIGDREWKRGLLGRQASDPIPFRSMPLCLERCFGGQGHAANPLGVGIAATGDRWALPNIEDPRTLIDSPRARPNPASAFPIPRNFESRLRLAGAYDEAWLKTRWPHLPEGFDFAYFNAAPADLQRDGWFRGDEDIVLDNLHPERPRLRSKLPGIVPRCFLDGAGSFRELPLVLDTITVDADAGRAFAVWRGVVEVRDETLSDVTSMLIAEERLGAQEPAAAHQQRLAARSSRDQQEEAIAPEPPPPAPPLPRPERARAPSAAAGAEALAKRVEILARIERRESMVGQDLTGADLRETSLEETDLSGAILTRAKLDGAKLSGARLDGTSLGDASLVGANLSGVSLVRADLTGADAASARFDGSVLDGAVLERARLAGAVLASASAKGADFAGADLSGADLSAADLAEADFSRAKLDRAVLDRAVLRDASLEGASALSTRFVGTDLERLRASGGRFADATLCDVNAPASVWRGAALDGAAFSRASLPGADFTGASLVGAKLPGCDLKGARMIGARLGKAVLSGSSFFEASFESADLTGADLSGSCCFGAELWKATIQDTRFDGANLERTKLAPGGTTT